MQRADVASLHFCIVGAGVSDWAHGHTMDEYAGSGAKCVCSAVVNMPQQPLVPHTAPSPWKSSSKAKALLPTLTKHACAIDVVANAMM